MAQRPRIYYTESQKALMWERWQKGESLQQIAQLFDRNHSSIQRILAESGGIRPAQRCRAKLALTLAEREEISRGLVAGHSLRSIAAQLGRAPSTISREITCSVGQQGYRANQADQLAWDRARRPKTCKLVENRTLAHIVADKLQLQWSPQQIAGWLKCTYPCSEEFQVSHETIYRSLFIQTRGALKKELLAHLRRTRVMPAHAITPRRRAITAESPMPCRLASAPPALRIVRYRVTGKGIFCSAMRIARSPPWLNVRRAM